MENSTDSKKIDIKKIHNASRNMDVNLTWKLVTQTNPVKFSWCWGTHAPVRMTERILRFKVDGLLHKGHVYLCVNGLDLFDIYLTTTMGTIKHIIKDVYIDVLVETIDNHVENDKNIYS